MNGEHIDLDGFNKKVIPTLSTPYLILCVNEAKEIEKTYRELRQLMEEELRNRIYRRLKEKVNNNVVDV